MGEYGREQRKQLSRMIVNNGEVSRQLKGFVDNRFQTGRCRNMQYKADQTTNSGYVIQQSKKGMGLGGLIGAGIGALGFLANPILGSALLSAGALVGAIAGHYLTSNQTEISSENQRLLPNTDAQEDEILQEITLREDEVGEASQSITYPSVTSCMTITLILEDGNRIGGHLALYGNAASNVIDSMNKKRGGRKVKTIVAKGHIALWGKELENASELTPKVQKKYPQSITDDDKKWAETLLSHSVERNQEYFCTWIVTKFGRTGTVILQGVEDGDVTA